MGKSVIPEGKRRYSLCLTKDNYDWLHHFVTKECKQARGQIGVIIDEMITNFREETQPILDIKKKTGQNPNTADMLILLGESIQRSGKLIKDDDKLF
jgi:hypothetical protein